METLPASVRTHYVVLASRQHHACNHQAIASFRLLRRKKSNPKPTNPNSRSVWEPGSGTGTKNLLPLTPKLSPLRRIPRAFQTCSLRKLLLGSNSNNFTGPFSGVIPDVRSAANSEIRSSLETSLIRKPGSALPPSWIFLMNSSESSAKPARRIIPTCRSSPLQTKSLDLCSCARQRVCRQMLEQRQKVQRLKLTLRVHVSIDLSPVPADSTVCNDCVILELLIVRVCSLLDTYFCFTKRGYEHICLETPRPCGWLAGCGNFSSSRIGNSC